MLSIFKLVTTMLLVETSLCHSQPFEVGLISETVMPMNASSVDSNNQPVTIRHLVTQNATLQEIVSNICADLISRRVVAVIGAADTATNSAVANMVGYLSIPFVGLNPTRSGYHVNLFPSAMDRYRSILSLSRELASSSVLVFTSDAYNRQLFHGLRNQFASNGIHLDITFINANGDPTTVILEISKQMLMMNKSDSYLAVLDCGPDQVELVINTANFLGVSSQRISWVMVGDAMDSNHDNTERIPRGVLGIRVPFTKDELLQDALTLVSIALVQHNFQWPHLDAILHNASCSFERHPPGSAGTWLSRVLKNQSFVGKTGLVQFDELGARVNADYQIVRMTESNPSSRRKWERVGLISNNKIHLESDFWLSQTNLTDRASNYLIRMVTAQDYPLVIAHKPSPDAGANCILTQPCFKFAKILDQETNTTSVRPIKYCCSGYMIDLLRLILRDLPTILVEIYFVEDGKYGSYDPETKQWNGIINDLIQGKADVALTALTINEKRAGVVDFSNAFLHGETKIMVSPRKSDEEEIEFGFLKPFDPLLWTAAVVMINVLVLVVWWFDRSSPRGHHRAQSGNRKHTFNMPECMSFIWSCVFKLQLNDVTPRSHSARMASAFFSFGTLILTTSYTANLAAYLVNINEVVPVSGIRDAKFFDSSSGFKFAVLESSSTEMIFSQSSDPHYRQIHKNMKFVSSYKEAIEKLQSGELDAFIDDSPFLDVLAAKQPDCSFRIVGRPISLHGYGLAFRRGFKFSQPITQLLLKYARRDYFRALTKKWFDSMCTTGEARATRATSLSFGALSGLFLFCSAATMTCVPLLISELLFYRFTKRSAVTYAINLNHSANIEELVLNTRL